MDDRSTYPAGLLTFLLGGLAGASIALLFAPPSGTLSEALDASERGVKRAQDTLRRSTDTTL